MKRAAAERFARARMAPGTPSAPLTPAARWRRLAWCAACVVVAAVLVVGPWPLDRSGFAGQAYSNRSLRRLARAAAASPIPSRTGSLMAGFGEADITPRPGEPLAGYGKRHDGGCRGVHDAQRARALALSGGGRAVVLITADLLLVSDGLADAVTRRLARTQGLQRDQIYFCASHTHSGPGGFGTSFIERFWLGAPRPEVFERLAERLASAAAQALRTMSPASWCFRSVRVPEAVQNRVAPGLPVDADLSVLAVRTRATRRTCLLTVFGAHPTILGPANLLASSDYPGYLAEILERAPGVKVLFCAGAVGSTSCRGLPPARDFLAARAYAARLAQRVSEMLAGAPFSPTAAVTCLYAPVELGPLQFRLGGSLRASPLAGGLLIGARQGCLQALTVGPVVFLGAPGDINGELSLKIKEHARARGFQAVVTSFAGRYVGYLLPAYYYNDFVDNETRLMSMFGPLNGEYVSWLMESAVDRLAGGRLP
jgi:neutral ceramidase